MFDAKEMVQRILSDNSFFAPNEVMRLDSDQKDLLAAEATRLIDSLKPEQLRAPSGRVRPMEGFYTVESTLKHIVDLTRIRF